MHTTYPLKFLGTPRLEGGAEGGHAHGPLSAGQVRHGAVIIVSEIPYSCDFYGLQLQGL